MTTQLFDYKFMVEKVDADTAGYIKGIATTPKIDSYDDIIAAGAFAKSIQERGVSGPRAIKMLAQHDSRHPIGNWKSLVYQGDQLQVEGLLDLENQKGQEYYGYLKKDQIGSLSVGFRTISREYNEDTYVRTITVGDLREISLVTFPANEDAVITQVKSMLDDDNEKLSDIEKLIVRKFGLSRNKASLLIREIRRSGVVASAPVVPAATGVPHSYEQANKLIMEMKASLETRKAIEEIEKIHSFLRL